MRVVPTATASMLSPAWFVAYAISASTILWRSAEHKEKAATALRLTASDLHEIGICDEIVEEPDGGAHTDWDAAADYLAEALGRTIEGLSKLSTKKLLAQRWAKYEAIGDFRAE